MIELMVMNIVLFDAIINEMKYIMQATRSGSII